jgi:hypothetical protein
LSFRRFSLIRLAQALFTLSLAIAPVYTRMIRAELMRTASDRERRRQIPGLARLALIGYQAKDLVLMQAAVLYAAFLGIAASFLVDAIVAALDLRGEWRFVARPKRAT